jgi:ATP-dependent protease HslVU (ClpYQ) peptidase subunit
LSCVVGFISSNKVYFGADSAEVGSDCVDLRADPKVFQRGNYLFGFVGSWRFGQLIQYEMPLPTKVPKLGESVHEWMVKQWVPRIMEATKELKEEERGNVLIGFSHIDVGRMYAIYGHNYQVAAPMNDYYALGSGEQVAKGAMYAGLKYIRNNPTQIIGDALQAASQFCTGVRSPFLILSV